MENFVEVYMSFYNINPDYKSNLIDFLSLLNINKFQFPDTIYVDNDLNEVFQIIQDYEDENKNEYLKYLKIRRD